MREILFRGKSKADSKWMRGNLFSDPDVDRTTITEFSYYADADGLQREWEEQEVDSSTVGQYIGLKDKHGKKIFEGDILYIAGQGIIEVEFPFEDLYRWAGEDDIEQVLGNIYDNPELISDKERKK